MVWHYTSRLCKTVFFFRGAQLWKCKAQQFVHPLFSKLMNVNDRFFLMQTNFDVSFANECTEIAIYSLMGKLFQGRDILWENQAALNSFNIQSLNILIYNMKLSFLQICILQAFTANNTFHIY